MNKEKIACLKEYLYELRPLPPLSALLGHCTDDLPFLLDLTDPKPGSLAIFAKDHMASNLFQSIVASAVEINPYRDLRVCVLADELKDWAWLEQYKHLYKLRNHARSEVSALINYLSRLSSIRTVDRRLMPVTLLVIENLTECVNNLNIDELDLLSWLLLLGPGQRIWPFVGIDWNHWSLTYAFLDCCKSWIYSGISPQYVLEGEFTSADMEKRYMVRVADKWVFFELPWLE